MVSDEDGNIQGRVTQRDLYDAIEKLRLEQRADRKEMKEDILAAFKDAVSDFRGFTESHNEAHDRLEQAGTKALQRHLDEVHDEETRAAGQKEMFLGPIRFVETNWKVIGVVIAALFTMLHFIEPYLPAILNALFGF